VNITPVTYDAAGLTKKTATFANSFVDANLPNELSLACFFASSSKVELFSFARADNNSSTLSVSVQPGKMELNLMPSLPWSKASDLVNPNVPARTLLDNNKLGIGCFAAREVIVNTEAESDFFK